MKIGIYTYFLIRAYCTLCYHPGYMRSLPVLHLLLFCMVFVCISRVSYAQTWGLKPGADTAAINQLLKAAKHTINPDSALIIYDKALKLSTDVNYADGALSALMNKGIQYEQKEDFIDERNCCIRALSWAPRSSMKDGVAWCYNGIGNTYVNDGDYIEASVYFYKALDEVKKMPGPPTHNTANVYNNLGFVNIRLDQPEQAFAYFKQAENISREWHLDYQLANALTNEGEYYNSINHPDSAIVCFNNVMQIGKRMGRTDLQANAYDDLGAAYIKAGEYQKAIPLLQQSIAIAQNHYPYTAADASFSLGDALSHTGKYKEAEAILEGALKETRTHNLKDDYIDCFPKLIAVYKATGQYKKALDYTDSLTILKDSLLSSEKAKAINQMEIKFKTSEKDKQIVQSQLLIAQQRSNILSKNTWIAAIAGSIILLSIILVSMFLNSRHKQRLQEERIKTLQQESTIGILKGVVQGEEKERGRIARELHDGIGGMLSAAMMRMMSIRHEKEEITSVPAYIEAMDLLQEMGDEIRKTAHNLMPEVLLKQSLPEAIRTYCNFVEKGKTLQVDFQSFGSFDNITQKNKLNIYRIIQEMLKNITEHANARHALLQLQVNEQLLTITVEDDGRGFNTEEIKKGIGLHNLQTRVDSMSGHFTIESGAGKGTSVYIEFDMHKMTVDDNI